MKEGSKTGQPIRILLAEDNPADQRLLMEALRHHDLEHELHVIANGEDALQAVQAVGQGTLPCPDLLILDLGLPRVDGMEVLQEFRAHQHCKTTPVLVLTSSSSPAQRLRAERLAGVHFMEKPLELDAYLSIGEMIRRFVGRTGCA